MADLQSEVLRTTHSPHKESLPGKRILHVPPNFAISDFTQPLSQVSHKRESDTVDLFVELGFDIKRQQKFNPNNPLEIGIHSNLLTTLGRPEVDSVISKEVGISMPRRFSINQIIQNDEPIVAKRKNEHGGDSIYLLETPEQKVRFVSYVLSYNNVTSTKQLNELMARVKKEDLRSDNEYSAEKSWFFEEYIDTPSDFYTSFRVVADCFGKVHHGVLIRSSERKSMRKIEDSMIVAGTRVTPENFIEFYALPGAENEAILNCPSSPLYLGAKSIVSNVRKGGKAIPLNSSKVIDPEDREILLTHNINPDDPSIPEVLIDTTAKIGVISRGDYPFVGVDFILRKDGQFSYLETNFGPAISPQLIGLSSNTDPSKSHLAFMKKVLSSL